MQKSVDSEQLLHKNYAFVGWSGPSM
jgi:hypothetical protein